MNNLEQADPILIPLQDISFSQNQGIDCGSCSAICCSEGTALPLTSDEAWSLIEAGTDLERIDADNQLSKQDIRRGAVFYKLLTKCGNLDQPIEGGPGVCTAFDSPDRPAICREFKTGSFYCKVMRSSKEQGVA